MVKKRGRSAAVLAPLSAAMTVTLAMLLAEAPQTLAVLPLLNPVLAQASTFPLPSTVPSGTQVGIDGSSSMATVNQSLKQRFESRFSGTQINLAYGGSAAALQAVLNGSRDLAAVGRPLSPEEKNQGLVEVPVSRNKIALIVSPENPFRGSLTIEQFAQIFRGEITNWSQLGGEDVPIRLIDRPDSSDTRQAFQTYQVFQVAPFQPGGNVVKLTEDSTEAVVRELGRDGLGYAIADQALNQPNIQVLDMYGTFPNDPLYPFSQPLNYVYKGPTANPGVQAFLGFATAPETQAVVEAERPQSAPVAAANAAPNPTGATGEAGNTAPGTNAAAGAAGVSGAVGTASPGTAPATSDPNAAATPGAAPGTVLTTPGAGAPGTAPDAATGASPTDGTAGGAATDQGGFPWWMLPVLAAAGALLWFVLRGRGDDEGDEGYLEEETAAGSDLPDQPEGSISTVSTASDYDSPNFLETAAGGVGRAGNGLGGVAAGLGGAALGAAGAIGLGRERETAYTATTAENRIILVPRDCRNAYAYWEVPEDNKAALRTEGNERLLLRLYEMTPNEQGQQIFRGVKQFQCNETDSDRHISIPNDDRSYLVELGYLTAAGNWSSLGRSQPVHIPACVPNDPDLSSPTGPPAAPASSVTADSAPAANPLQTASGRISDAMSGFTATLGNLGDRAMDTGAAAVGAGAAAVGAGAAAVSSLGQRPEDTSESTIAPAESRIILVPRNAYDAYVYWEVAESHKATLRQQGGTQLMLRLYDVTDADLGQQPQQRFQEFECREGDRDYQVSVPESDRDYQAELGYLTPSGDWLSLARSAPMPFFSMPPSPTV